MYFYQPISPRNKLPIMHNVSQNLPQDKYHLVRCHAFVVVILEPANPCNVAEIKKKFAGVHFTPVIAEESQLNPAQNNIQSCRRETCQEMKYCSLIMRQL